MAAVINLSSATDEEWLVLRARNCLKSDPYSTKAWLITARTLFPRNFSIQLEGYMIEKNAKNIPQAAKLLEEMFVNFPQEQKLWDEVRSFSGALQSENSDEKTKFDKDLFAALPSTLQCHILLSIAENTADMMEQCRLMVVILKRYPQHIPEQGMKLIESLLATEKHTHSHTPVNCYRKYLVCDVLPLVLQHTQPDLSQKHLYRWLQKSIEFYVAYVTHPPSQSPETLLSPGATLDLMSPTKKMSFSMQGLKRVHIAGLSEKDSLVTKPWARLFDLMELFAKQFKWDVGDLFTNQSREAQWQQLHFVFQNLSKKLDDVSNQKELLFCATVLFLDCLYIYSSRMDPEQFYGVAALKHFSSLVLIEGFKSSEPVYEHKSKKMKVSSEIPHINPTKSIQNSDEVIINFSTALKCWDLLHSVDSIGKEFQKLCQGWKADSWMWLKNFEVDVYIYQGRFKDAIAKIQSLQGILKGASSQVRNDLQLACCYYSVGSFLKSSECILNVVKALPHGVEPAPPAQTTASGTGRQLQLLKCSEAEVLPYCIQLMITCFREKAFKTLAPDDMSLGHMIVLLQYDWPRYEMLFSEAVQKIRRNGNFTYNLFFNYVINIDILEEFAFIKTQDGGKASLDILPTSSKILAQQRTVTRGVNKGVKEDFKATMEKQVARSYENIETIIRQFLVDEKDLLQQTLL